MRLSVAGTLRAAAVVAALAVTAVAIAYVAIIHRPPRPAAGEAFDLVVVFGGDPERVRVAFQQCQRGLGQAVVVSDSNTQELADYVRQFGAPGKARILMEPYARTTDQNARLVGRIIQREGFRHVLLVTSWFHQPRAYLLMRLALSGQGVDLKLLSSDEAPARYYLTPEFRKEFLKFWGSLGRWAKSILRTHGLLYGARVTAVD